jgi:hypothetical protein
VSATTLCALKISRYVASGVNVRRVGHGAQTRQVEHLHAVRACAVGHDERVVPDHLDVAPDGRRRALRARQVADELGRDGSVTSTNDAPSRRATSA